MRRRRIPVALRLPTRLRLGHAIRDARRMAGLTQEALGRRLGLKGRAIYRWERNETAPSHHHRVALLREIHLFNSDAAKQLQFVFTERTGKVYGIALEATQASAPSQPNQGTTDGELRPYVGNVPASTVASLPQSGSTTSDILEIAIFKMADELDLPPRRARRALARLLDRLQSARFAFENLLVEVTRLVAEE